jgi:acyl-CoA hydrolase
LFRYDGRNWLKYEDNVRMTTSTLGETQTNDPLLVRRKLKASFVNNTTTATIGGEVVPERQALSKVLKARADN